MGKHSKQVSIKTRRRVRGLVKLLTVIFGVIGFALAFILGAWSIESDYPFYLPILTLVLLGLSLAGIELLSATRGGKKK